MRGSRFFYEPAVSAPRNYRMPPASAHSHTVSSSTAHAHTTATSTADVGTFVDADGLPANNESVVCGVVASDGSVTSSGVVQAYVMDTGAAASLSGIYQKTINGIAAGKVVLIYDDQDRSFIMASTKSSELVSLKNRLDALTGPT